MGKIIVTGNEFKIKMKSALDLVYSLVSATLGPWGTNVVLDKGFSVPITTNDGVSIARAIEVEDDAERLGVEMIKEVALKTNEEAGDGTTTSIVLAHALVQEGLKYNDNPIEIRKSLDLAKIKALEELDKVSIPLKTDKDLLHLATVSTESEELGKIIADTFVAVGRNGVVIVEESKYPDTKVKVVEGYEVEKGFVSPYMQNEQGKADFKDANVIVIAQRLDNLNETVELFNKMLSWGKKEFVLFCVDMDNTILNTILLNKQQQIFNCLVVKAHSQNNEILQDIATVTKATFISDDAGKKVSEIKLSDIGGAERIVATKDKTTIQGGKGKVKEEVKELQESLSAITDDNEYDLVEKRIARLNNEIAVISSGAKTETQMRDRFYKLEDGVNAVKSAIEEGVVEGGGLALYRISQKLMGNSIGERILSTALKAPFKKIIENSNRDYAEIVMGIVKGHGYDAKNDIYVDMFKAGIIDPKKVERCCIENAVSFAGTFLTSKSAIALVREKPKDA